MVKFAFRVQSNRYPPGGELHLDSIQTNNRKERETPLFCCKTINKLLI